MNSRHRDPRIYNEEEEEEENITSVTQLNGPSVFSNMDEGSESGRNSNSYYEDYFPSKEIFTNALKLSELWEMGMAEYKPLNETQLTFLMSQMEKRSTNEHVCLLYSKPPSHLQFNPYSLQIVRPKDLNNSNFFTLSKYGLIFFSNVFPEYTEYIQMSDFIQEMRMYERVHKIKFFQKFCLLKNFTTWLKNVQSLKFQKASLNLERNLVVIQPKFSAVIPKILKLANEISSMILLKVEDNQVYELEEFMSAQQRYLNTLKFTLQEFQSNVTELVMSVCNDSRILLKLQESFIQIVDYILCEAYHQVLKRSLLTLTWEIKLRTGPQILEDEDEHFIRLSTDLRIDVQSNHNRKCQPLFSLAYHFDWNETSDEHYYNYCPSEIMLKSAFTDLIHMWTESILTVSSIKDSILQRNTNYKQMNQIRRKKLLSLFETDSDLQLFQENLHLCLERTFKTFTIFTTLFDVISQFCRNSKLMDISNFQTYKGLKTFKAQFEAVRKGFQSITTNFPQGIFQFNDKHLIEVIHTTLITFLELLHTVKLSHGMKCKKCKKIKILNNLIDSMEMFMRMIDRDSQRNVKHHEIVVRTLHNGVLETTEHLNMSLDICQLIENQLHLYHLNMSNNDNTKEKKQSDKNSYINSTTTGNLTQKLCIIKQLCTNNQNNVINQRALLEKLHYINNISIIKDKKYDKTADNK